MMTRRSIVARTAILASLTLMLSTPTFSQPLVTAPGANFLHGSGSRMLSRDPLVVVRAARGSSATMGPHEAAAVLATIARELGPPYGRLAKTAGNYCSDAAGRWACDIICNQETRQHWDVFGDGPDGGGNPEAPGRATPSWNLVKDDADQPLLIDRARCLIPPAAPEPPAPPDNPPVTPGPDLAALVAAVNRLTDQVGALEARVEALAAAPPPILTCPAPAFAWPRYTMRSPWGIGTFVLKPDPPTSASPGGTP